MFPGTGMPSDRCAWNADPQRKYAPPKVAAASKAIENLQTKIDRVEEKIEDLKKEDCIKKCGGTRGAVDKAIRLVDSREVVDMYIEHLSCEDTCPARYTQVSYYNKWASAYGLPMVFDTYDNNNYSSPNRAIASQATLVQLQLTQGQCSGYGKKWMDDGCYQCRDGEWNGSRCVSTGEGSSTPPPSPRPSSDNRPETRPTSQSCSVPGKVFINGRCQCPGTSSYNGSRCVCPGENETLEGLECVPFRGDSDGGVVPAPEPIDPPPVIEPVDPVVIVDPVDSQCQRPNAGKLNQYAMPDCALDVRICQEAAGKRGFSGTDKKNCEYCLKPTSTKENGRYSDCLVELADLEMELAELEDEMDELKDALDDAEDDAAENGTESSVCIDCIKDNRGFFERYGPTLAHGLLAAYGVKQAKNQYQEIWEDNNAKGYTSDPRGGYALSSLMLGQGLGVLNTAYSTGAFGCTQGSLWGNGNMAGNFPPGLVPGQSGGNVNAQVGGFNGISSGLLSALYPGANMSGGIFQQNGGTGPWNVNSQFGIPNNAYLAGSIFGGGNLNQQGINQNGSYSAEYYAQVAAQARQQAQIAEAQEAAQRQSAAVIANANAQLSSINSGLGTINTVNSQQGAGGSYGYQINAGFNLNGGTQIPLRPHGSSYYNGDPNMMPQQPTNQGLPSGIPSSSSGGPASDIGI